jgi:excisionase family DNA binding protein
MALQISRLQEPEKPVKAEPQSEFLTVQEVAHLLRCGSGKIYKMLQEGKLPGKKIGNTWRVWRRELEEFLESQSNQKGGQIND